jgi:Leucine-rich repeat (LRR) protein
VAKQLKDVFLMNEDESYAEALRRIGDCGKKGGKKLDFSDFFSLKTIPPEITGLETLAELDITGLKKIPDFIGSIRSLKMLSIGSRHSDVHEYEKEKIVLPRSLAGLSNLQNLHVGYNVELPEWLWNMDSLSALTIFNDSSENITPAIGNLKNLRQLRIHGKNISSLPGTIAELPLVTMDLSCPKLESLPASFSNLKKVTALHITNCNFSALPGFLCDWPELAELMIGMENTFQGPYTELTKIPENIGNLKKLRILDLEGTSIRKIPESLGYCPLERLKISGDFQTMPETFGKLTNLKKLELTAYKLKKLPPSFGRLVSLEELDLYGRIQELPESFGNLSSLKKLSIRTEENILLPETFGDLAALEELYIEADTMKTLPGSIGKCGALKIFILTSDEIRKLPESLGKLISLEQFHVDAFNLEKIPDTLGNLGALKHLDIFSGALAAFPESMGKLKKLETLWLDAYHVQELPASFEKLSYVKNKNINTGRKEQAVRSFLCAKKRDASVPGFDELKYMSHKYRRKIFEKFSVRQLETLLCSAPRRHNAGELEKEIVKNIILVRCCRLNRKFKWTAENIRRITEVSDKFLAAWEEGFVKAKVVIDMLYEKAEDKDRFWDNYDAEIILDPEILLPDTVSGEFEYPVNGVYSVLMDYFNAEFELDLALSGDYDPETKNENGFRENIHINHDLSWNIEGFGDIDLKDHYICYAIYVLYSHNNWANADILKINNISSEVRVTCLHNTGPF